MTVNDLNAIADYIAARGASALREYTSESDFHLDYVAIFAKDDEEWQELQRVTESLGNEIDKETGKTGRTFWLQEPIETTAGPLRLLKIRKPDPTRPQRGAPDFKIANYKVFKGKYLMSSGNFTLMARKGYEMIELKGADVLVYIPSETLRERLGK